jgi:hypothetical protein
MYLHNITNTNLHSEQHLATTISLSLQETQLAVVSIQHTAYQLTTVSQSRYYALQYPMKGERTSPIRHASETASQYGYPGSLGK